MIMIHPKANPNPRLEYTKKKQYNESDPLQCQAQLIKSLFGSNIFFYHKRAWSRKKFKSVGGLPGGL